MPAISVVIPALNDADMLRNSLRYLAEQVRPADEIIVVDNGSTDDTAAVARSFGATVVDQPLRGIASAASTGYDTATGDIIARIDADSHVPVDWLAHIEAEFQASPDIGVLTGPGDFYDGNPVTTFLAQHLYISGYFWFMTLWLDNGPIFGSNFAMRREVWRATRDRVHRTTRTVHDDLDLSFHLAPNVVTRVDETLRVGISARPLATWRGFGRRLSWAYLTLQMHWTDSSPWRIREARRELLEQRAAGLGEGDDAQGTIA